MTLELDFRLLSGVPIHKRHSLTPLLRCLRFIMLLPKRIVLPFLPPPVLSLVHVDALDGEIWDDSPKTWKNLLAKVKPDSSPLPLRLYRQATVLLGAMVTAATVAIILKISHIRYSFITQKKQKGFLV